MHVPMMMVMVAATAAVTTAVVMVPVLTQVGDSNITEGRLLGSRA